MRGGVSVIPRRAALGLAGAGALSGCGVLARPAYVQRRVWPIAARRPVRLAAPVRGPVLAVRALTAGPGLDATGVEWLRPDGSLHVDFYNQWAVPPAEGVTDALRRWLAASGRFGAVVGPDSGLAPALTLEGELTAFLGEPARFHAEVRLALVLRRGGRLLAQRVVTGRARLADAAPEAVVRATLAALAGACAGVERLVAAA